MDVETAAGTGLKTTAVFGSSSCCAAAVDGAMDAETTTDVDVETAADANEKM